MNKGAKPKNEKPAITKSDKNDRQKSKQKSEKKEKVVKKPADKKDEKENGPKRNKNAYMFFTEEMRPKVAKDKPELKGKEVLSVIFS